MSRSLSVKLIGRNFGEKPTLSERRYWLDDHALKTHLMNALSAVFPIGERFFIDSVRAYEGKISDPQLQKDVRIFIAQEAHHSKEHMALNAVLAERGYDTDRLVSHMRWKIKLMKRLRNQRSQLCMTVCAEHLTALLAHGLLADPDFLQGASEEDKRLWRWHAIEEIEHKGVAFDVYMQQGGSYWHRCYCMVETSIFFSLDIFVFVLKLLKQDGQLSNFAMWKSGLRFLWGKSGVFRRLLPHYKAFFKRDFHPWDHDNRDLIEKYSNGFSVYSMPEG